MSEQNSVPLVENMDEMISSSYKNDHQPQYNFGGRGFRDHRGRRGRGFNYDGKPSYLDYGVQGEQAQIRHCFDCMREGIRTKFFSKQALESHKAYVHGLIMKKKCDEPQQYVAVRYIWSNEGMLDESMLVEHDNGMLLEISSSGEIELIGEIRHISSVFCILNTCLSLLGYHISLENPADIEGNWVISNQRGWIEQLENNMSFSAFSPQAWSDVKAQLQTLPDSVAVVDHVKLFARQMAGAMEYNFGMSHTSGMGMGMAPGMVMGPGVRMAPAAGMPAMMGGGMTIPQHNMHGIGSPYMGYPMHMMPMMMQMGMPMMVAQNGQPVQSGQSLGMDAMVMSSELSQSNRQAFQQIPQPVQHQQSSQLQQPQQQYTSGNGNQIYPQMHSGGGGAWRGGRGGSRGGRSGRQF